MITKESKAKATELRNEWAKKVEAALIKFREEYKKNPFMWGYLETQYSTSGHTPGAEWFTSGGILWLHVTPDEHNIVTLERPLGEVFILLNGRFEQNLAENLLYVTQPPRDYPNRYY